MKKRVPASAGTEALPYPSKPGVKAYPREARDRGIEGLVLCLTGFDEHGRVVEVKVVETPGFGLDEAAREYILTTVWNPGLRDGKPAAFSIVIPVLFRLVE